MSRQHRLNAGGSMTLYHQTDAQSARSIVATGTFHCGTAGLAGGGIYFASSASHTQHKAHKKGVVITCSVKVGKMKTLSKTGDASLNGHKLNQQGYDSVCIPRDNGYEYVVYNSDQIEILRYSGLSMETHRCSNCKRHIPDHMAVGQKLCASCQHQEILDQWFMECGYSILKQEQDEQEKKQDELPWQTKGSADCILVCEFENFFSQFTQ